MMTGIGGKQPASSHCIWRQGKSAFTPQSFYRVNKAVIICELASLRGASKADYALTRRTVPSQFPSLCFANQLLAATQIWEWYQCSCPSLGERVQACSSNPSLHIFLERQFHYQGFHKMVGFYRARGSSRIKILKYSREWCTQGSSNRFMCYSFVITFYLCLNKIIMYSVIGSHCLEPVTSQWWHTDTNNDSHLQSCAIQSHPLT